MTGQFFADGIADELGTVGSFFSGALIQTGHELTRHPDGQQLALWLFPRATLHDEVYIFNLYSCQHFFGFLGGKAV